MGSDIVGKVQELDANMREISNLLRKGPHRMLLRKMSSHVLTRPLFMSSWIMRAVPPANTLLTQYRAGNSQVKLYRTELGEGLYYLDLPEVGYNVKEVEVLERTRESLYEAEPEGGAIGTIAQAREYVLDYGLRNIQSKARETGIGPGDMDQSKVRDMSEALSRYTAGLSVFEPLLTDEHVQDIYVDAPSENSPVYVTLGGLGRHIPGLCRTNIIASSEDIDAFLSRLRYESGRPFSEVDPVLECDIPFYGARATLVGPPLSPGGIGIALRRHSSTPWTLPSLIRAGSISPWASALLSFLIDGRATIIIAGGRGAGKTSLLGALMLEFPTTQRMLAIEDTPELPVDAMKDADYNVQRLLYGTADLEASDALRVSLRLGESALVLGEMRGSEIQTLYEAMRAGTAGSSVLGTFHANSAPAVYERVVHDLGITPKSFLATDLIVVAGLTRPKGVQRSTRRVTEITEVKKGGEADFSQLMRYDPAKDSLVARNNVKDPGSKLSAIGREWGMDLEEVMANIGLRANIKSHLADRGRDKPAYLGVDSVRIANSTFWSVVENMFEKEGQIDYKKAYNRWRKGFEERFSPLR